MRSTASGDGSPVAEVKVRELHPPRIGARQPLDRAAVPARERVEDRDPAPRGREQVPCGVGADVAGAAGDEEVHAVRLSAFLAFGRRL